ncbi:hypothetical protein CEXT_441531 [Caerostris extrusa]|uniref:Uncharacterized protein n=1 Tax=Caerostris extrusa TaxID=172846 RepID=A0AAV4XN63_CAEEX|nr:hypothetical protein CEXT_441531 [Caerostris extrusa]
MGRGKLLQSITRPTNAKEIMQEKKAAICTKWLRGRREILASFGNHWRYFGCRTLVKEHEYKSSREKGIKKKGEEEDSIGRGKLLQSITRPTNAKEIIQEKKSGHLHEMASGKERDISFFWKSLEMFRVSHFSQRTRIQKHQIMGRTEPVVNLFLLMQHKNSEVPFKEANSPFPEEHEKAIESMTRGSRKYIGGTRNKSRKDKHKNYRKPLGGVCSEC